MESPGSYLLSVEFPGSLTRRFCIYCGRGCGRRCPAIQQQLSRLWPGRVRICQALRRFLRGFCLRHLPGAAVFPSILKQYPRYFYKGTGSKRSRLLYALANSVICKGDNGRWQPNYSAIFGSLAAGGLSNLYYPAEDRNGARLTFENAAIGIGTTGAVNVIEEFVIRKFAHPSNHESQGN